MKSFRILMAAMAMLTACGASAQGTDSTMVVNDSAQAVIQHATPEVMPEYPGGKSELILYLTTNLRYPELAKEYGAEGRVVMDFIVDYDGSLTDISARNCNVTKLNEAKLSQETEARKDELREAIALLFAREGARVIREMPKWSPARRMGVAVRVKYSLPIRFMIPE